VSTVIALLVALPPLGVLAMVLLNLAVWPRGRPEGAEGSNAALSVLIPARDEEVNIAAALRSVISGSARFLEVLVYDDGSGDGTAREVERVAAEEPRVRLIRGGPLPAGWVGKVHACHRLAAEARGDVLCYLDADVRITGDGLARLLSVMEACEADLVSVAPRQEMRSAGERLLLPFLLLTYLAWLPLPLVWRSRDPRFLVANGQLLAVRREALHRAGGWAAVRGAVVDDLALARRVKESGGRVVFADGSRMASCRMYRGLGEVWNGFSKNVFAGLGARPALLVVAVTGSFLAFLAPWIALPLAIAAGAPAVAGAAMLGIGANGLMRAVLAVRYGHPPVGVLLHPLGAALAIAIALNSYRWHRAGAVVWRGRSYPVGAGTAGR